MTETFIKERKHTLTGKVEKVGIDDACAFLGRFANGSLGTVRIHPLRPRPQGRSTRSRSTASTPRSSGTCTTCTACSSSTTATRASSAAGRSIHVTDGDHPYMEQLVGARPADRLRAQLRPPGGRLPRRRSTSGKPAAPDLPRRARDAARLRRRAAPSMECPSRGAAGCSPYAHRPRRSGPMIWNIDSSRLTSTTWPSPVRSAWRSAASVAKAPTRPSPHRSPRWAAGAAGRPARRGGRQSRSAHRRWWRSPDAAHRGRPGRSR